jgi:hypothetical protein
VEIKFEDDSRTPTFVVAMQKISSIHEVISKATTKDEARLVSADEGGNVGLQTSRQNLRNTFDRCVLQGNGSEILRMSGVVLFRQEDKVRLIDAREAGAVVVESN